MRDSRLSRTLADTSRTPCGHHDVHDPVLADAAGRVSLTRFEGYYFPALSTWRRAKLNPAPRRTALDAGPEHLLDRPITVTSR